jgi:hypothetical protein
MHLLDDGAMNAAGDLAPIPQASSMPKNLNELPSVDRHEAAEPSAQRRFSTRWIERANRAFIVDLIGNSTGAIGPSYGPFFGAKRS